MAKKKAAPAPTDDDEEATLPGAGPKIAETPEEKEVLKTKAPKDKMTLQQYLEFSKMFGLNIGG